MIRSELTGVFLAESPHLTHPYSRGSITPVFNSMLHIFRVNVVVYS